MRICSHFQTSCLKVLSVLSWSPPPSLSPRPTFSKVLEPEYNLKHSYCLFQIGGFHLKLGTWLSTLLGQSCGTLPYSEMLPIKKSKI